MTVNAQLNCGPLVSIVTPIYNGEKYLTECIESVLAQTYHNWEYVIVNNCSTDRTLEIAQEHAAKESRIRLITNSKYLRAIENHNLAFRQISPDSKYCKMVFADDWIFPECLQQMVNVAEAHPSVGIVGAYGLWGTKVVWDGLPYYKTVVAGREIGRARLLDGFSVFGSPTSLLFRSDFIRARPLFFNESNLHADSEVCLHVLMKSDFGFVHQVLTYSREQDGSLTSYARRLNTYVWAILNELVKYGPFYLTEKEFRDRLAEHLSCYYRFLARSVFERRGREFWRLHKAKMEELGCPLNYGRLAAVVSRSLVNAVLNPKHTIQALLVYWTKVAAKGEGDQLSRRQVARWRLP
ncbi:MAG: glycosyltransferase [Acidobacteria bacterium]|nr:glycosyltransferase [Acidobacteriota bacterium]MCI0718397.1 glycosyltransferase [Acidobacteriota bacterium]